MPRTRGGSSFAAPSLSPEEQAYQRHYATIATKDIESSPILDFNMMEAMDIIDEFARLTQRVRFRSEFWTIPRQFRAYTEITREFLSSVTLYEDSQEDHYIRFLMQGQLHEVSLAQMRAWFHLAAPRTMYLGYSPDESDADEVGEVVTRETFWYQITGQYLPAVSPDPRVKAILHPALRVICRSLGSTIFARGESSLRPGHDELMLLATMLTPRPSFSGLI
jgi:hypothetical protein